MGVLSWVRSHRRSTGAIAAIAVVALAFGLYWFQPWKLVTRSTVNEAVPAAQVVATVEPGFPVLPGPVTVPQLTVTAPAESVPPSASALTSSPARLPANVVPASPAADVSVSVETPAPVTDPVPVPIPPAEPVALAAGMFVDGEHSTDGTATILRLPDGSRFLRLSDFSTSDGPDVRVILTDQPAGGDWGSFDDGRTLELGHLKGTDGNQNYEIPADVDLGGLRSAVIWCERFSVAFGSAELAAG